MMIFSLTLRGGISKLPLKLQEILKDENKREKLIIYINPPYAEAGNSKKTEQGGKKDVQINKTHSKYQMLLGKSSNELFAQFLIRIQQEIPSCKLANFSKLKILQSANFNQFRKIFNPKLKSLFLVPSDTFDNVKGQFPIGFFIWDLDKQEVFNGITADVYDALGNPQKSKKIHSYDNSKYISDWLGENYKQLKKQIEQLPLNAKTIPIGQLSSISNDFQQQNLIWIYSDTNNKAFAGGRHTLIYKQNLIQVAIYFSVRHCIEANWLNDRDQFLYPNELWENDLEFQSDCLAFTLFHSQNRISAKDGTNHFIPFNEEEVEINYSTFTSSFMYDFIKGKIKTNPNSDNLFSTFEEKELKPIEFSTQALEVFKSGLELWKYYHSFKSKDENINIDASFYDIREYFQKRNEKGKMNSSSSDETYTKLLNDLRTNIKTLGLKIEPKIYAYGFLKE